MESPIQDRIYDNTNKPTIDCYDVFTEYFLLLSPKRRLLLIREMLSRFNHPHIPYVLKTMDSNNVYHVMGYLRSLKLCELYNVIYDIVNNRSDGE
jgi:hypothetical protein